MQRGNLPVRIEHNFNVSPKKLFEAWINPVVVKRWLFKTDFSEIETANIQPQTTGSFAITEKTSSGDTVEHFGNYYSFSEAERLVFTLEVPKHFKGISLVDIRISPEADGSHMLFIQYGVPKYEFEKVWSKMFERLDKVIAENDRLMVGNGAIS